jgi:hypothetical protein
MTYDFKKFSALLTRAGITVIEAAKIFKTTRTTIYHWREGNTPKQELLLQFACKWISAIEKAIAAGDLPLLPETARQDRFRLIITALKKHSA